MIGYQKDGGAYGNILSIGEILNNREILTEAEVNVYPNPTKTHITISIPDQYSGGFDITIWDITGRKVLMQSDFNSNETLDAGKLESGTYLLSGSNESFTFSRKIVVE